MSNQILDCDWQPASSSLRRLDGASGFRHFDFYLAMRTRSFLVFPENDAAAEINRRRMHAALAISHISRTCPAADEAAYRKLRQYHLNRLGGDQVLAEGLGVDQYHKMFDDCAVAIKAIGLAVCFMARGAEHHGGASLSNAKDFVRSTLGVNRTEFRAYWNKYAAVGPICAALYHRAPTLWTEAHLWRAGWVGPANILEVLEAARDFEERIPQFPSFRKYRGRVQTPGDLWSVDSIIGDDFPEVELAPLDDEWLVKFVRARKGYVLD